MPEDMRTMVLQVRNVLRANLHLRLRVDTKLCQPRRGHRSRIPSRSIIFDRHQPAVEQSVECR